MKSIRSEKGMTLLELMLAIAIFAITAVVSVQSYLNAVRGIQLVNEEKNLVLLTGIKVEEMKTDILNVGTEKNGNFSKPYERYTWEVQLSEFSITETEYGTTFLPYSLTVRKDDRSFSMVIPFIEKMEHEPFGAENQ